ncbi:DUF2953 domain-containing protein [Brevibacillus laterosporus]|uniref:DUF2953 domain-containing protein n=1 Tax=Brevibacillus laterosporus TaxID=1465 RepID=UPI000E6CE452|nr:DUF2953 domain-containing protein [Brevibacillus laterosporus]AYB41318.1 DUF2953 domain-containing protein [Brevibacillus laterosporus]MBG9772102.1 membrane protein [Brevibacillus laterosporus]MBM7111762.1 hypothetical protein [Brevibacillus laterosporus]
MHWFLGSLTVLFLLLILLLITPIKIYLHYHRKQENDVLTIHIRVWKWIKINYELPMINLTLNKNNQPEVVAKVKQKGDALSNTESKKSIDTEDVDRWMHRVQELIERVQDFYPILCHALRHVYCEKLQWQTTIGIGDAAATGTLIGAVLGIKNMLASMLSYYISLQEMPRISVEPMWNATIIRTELSCVLFFRVGHVIVALVRIVIKMKKGSARKWQITPFRA